MRNHVWHEWEMLETLRIARLPRYQWNDEADALTVKMQEQTDPDMDAGRVLVAVRAAFNLLSGYPDRKPQASNALRRLHARQGTTPQPTPALEPAAVRRRQSDSVMPQPPFEWRPSKQERERLLGFEGYGPDDPDIIFVGLEEYCDPTPALQYENIRRRCTAPAYDGIRVDKNDALDALDGVVKTDVPVWDMMAKIVASLTGRAWQLERAALGSRPPHHRPATLLTELHALPCPGSKFEWQGSYLANWFSAEFASQQHYRRRSQEISGGRLLRIVEQHSGPAVVLFYGEPARRWATEHLEPVLSTKFDEARIATAKTKNGVLLVATGFYRGQDAATAFQESDIPELRRRIRAEIHPTARHRIFQA